MLVLDLRWLLFAALLVLAAATVTGFWIGRRLGSRENRPSVAGLREMIGRLEQAPFGVLFLEDSRTCRYANGHARQLLGLTSPRCPLPETPWVQLLDADRQALRREPAVPARYRNVFLPTSESEQSDRTSESRTMVRWWVVPTGDTDLVLLLDATAEHRAATGVRSLISDLSHQLRTPLATILTHLKVLRLPTVPDEIKEQSMGILEADTQRMIRLVNQLLELGRLETSAEVERQPVDLLSLAQECVVELSSMAEEQRVALSVEADAPLPPVMGDAYRLRQVFLNLLDNAIKYSQPGCRAVVSLKLERQGVRCSVCDNGPGIPAKHLPHLTRRFYRAAPQEVEGSGLGLAIAEEILRLHGSHLEIESRAEGSQTGTCVRFLLPLLHSST